jgi:hypothetical protein
VKTCVFAGPTLYREPWPTGIRRYGPAAMGSVFRAVEAGFRRVGIVDGLFGNSPSVWHKEILYAISAGVEVVGAGSMGALRAAELSGFGMIGIGRIFRLFRSGLWSDDDEVAVIHAGEELDYCPLSETMANVRFTLRRLRRSGCVDRLVETELVRRMKARHFSQRTRETLREEARRLVGGDAATRFIGEFESRYVDAKRLDAKALIAYLTRPCNVDRPRKTHAFQPTWHWREQFEMALADVPQLR